MNTITSQTEEGWESENRGSAFASTAPHANYRSDPTPKPAPNAEESGGANAAICPKDVIICPNSNCGYYGPALIGKAGSLFLAAILMLAFILPGLIYWIFCCKTEYVCPRCRCVARSEPRSSF